MIHTPIVFLLVLSQAHMGTERLEAERFAAYEADPEPISSLSTEDAADAAITESVLAAIQYHETLRYYSANCQVSTRGAIVMLSGTVPTDMIAQRMAQVAHAVRGVYLVVNLVNAQPSRAARARFASAGAPEAGPSADAAITGEVLGVIQTHGDLRYNAGSVQVTTNGAIVTLTGTVARDMTRQRIAQVAHAVRGVVRVDNLVRVEP